MANTLDTGKRVVDEIGEFEISADEWDGLSITDWFAADAGAPVPTSARWDEFDFAHQNPEAWQYVDFDVAMSQNDAILHMTKMQSRANPNHDKLGKFASGPGGKAKGFGEFTKSEATVVYGESYVKARVWSSGQHTIIVSDRRFPDAVVEETLIPQINRLQTTNPLPSGQLLNVSVEPVLFFKGDAVYGLTFRGTGNIKLNGGQLYPSFDADPQVDAGWLAPAAKGRTELDYSLAHEWGHSIDRESPKKTELYNWPDTHVSEYAGKNQEEAFAENFAEFYLSGGKTESDEALTYAEVFGWHS